MLLVADLARESRQAVPGLMSRSEAIPAKSLLGYQFLALGDRLSGKHGAFKQAMGFWAGQTRWIIAVRLGCDSVGYNLERFLLELVRIGTGHLGRLLLLCAKRFKHSHALVQELDQHGIRYVFFCAGVLFPGAQRLVVQLVAKDAHKWNVPVHDWLFQLLQRLDMPVIIIHECTQIFAGFVHQLGQIVQRME